MWKSVTSVLADGIKEFKEALIEDTPPSTPVGTEAAQQPLALSKEEIEKNANELRPSSDSQEPQIKTASAPVQSQTPMIVPPMGSPSNKERAPTDTWETMMLNNEIARLRQELEVAKARIKELEAQCTRCTAAPPDQDTVTALQEENKLLKKTMKQLMNKVVPPPDKAHDGSGSPDTTALA